MTTWEKIKHVVVEEDDKPAPTSAKPAPVTAAIPSVASVQIGGSVPWTPSGRELADNSSIYDRLAKKTDFKATETGRTMQEYLEPLAGLGFDEQTQFKTAFLQAQRHSNITPQNILDALASVDATLKAEEESFARSSKGFEDSIAADEAHAAELQKELQALTVQIAEERSRSERGKAEFAAAFQRRSAELDLQRAHYTTLLKG